MTGYAIQRLQEFSGGSNKAVKSWYLRHPLDDDEMLVIRGYPKRSCVTIYSGVQIILYEREILNSQITAAFLNFIFVNLCGNEETDVFKFFSESTQEEMDSAYLMFTLEGMGDGREDAR